MWWLFFSRARWSERLGALVVIVVAVLATTRVDSHSIAGAGMGIMFPFLAIETASLALVAWAVATRKLSDGVRRASMVVAILIGAAVWTLARTDGISSACGSEFDWRWTPTAEERLLAQAVDDARPRRRRQHGRPGLHDPREKPAGPKSPASIATSDKAGDQRRCRSPKRPDENVPAEWPGFRGPGRDSVVRGVRINTDWSAVAAGRAVAPADRAGLVVLRGAGRSSLHAGAAR